MWTNTRANRPTVLDGASLPLQRHFETSIDLLTVIGFGILAAAGQIPAPVGLVFLALFLPRFHPRFAARFHVEHRLGNLLSWIYVPLFLFDIFRLSGSFVPATLHLILFIQLVRSYQPSKQNRDYAYLLILSFLQVLAASSLTIDVSFLVLFSVYLLVALGALMAFEMKRAAERARPQDLGADQVDQPQPAPTAPGLIPALGHSRAARSLALVSLGSFVAIGVLGFCLFFAIPRVGSGYFQRAGRSSSLSGFSDTIRLGGIGTIQLDPAVVMRVRVKGDPALLKNAKWRGVTLDYFDGRSWSKQARGSTVQYPAGIEFPVQQPAGSGSLVSYEVWQEPSSTSYLFTVAQILHLRGTLAPLFRDPADDSFTARARRPLRRRLTYEGVSQLSQTGEASQREGLRPGGREHYLQLPSLEPRLGGLALNAAAGANSNLEKATRVERYLRTNYHYSLDQAQIENPEPLADFLLQTRRGHCEYFASAMVVLLRVLDVPARIVNGFQAGEYNDVGETFVFRGRDAHSWVEAWIPDRGWMPFDPTPASAEPFPRSRFSAVLGNYLDAFEFFWVEWVVGYDDVIQVSFFRDLQDKAAQWSWQGQQGIYRSATQWYRGLQAVAASAVRNIKRSPASIVTSLPVLLAAGLALWAGWRMRQRRWVKRAMRHNPAGLAARLYGEFLNLAATYGSPKPAAATASEFAATFKNSHVRRQVQEFTAIYQCLRFSAHRPAQETELRRATRLIREIERHARTRKALP